MRVSSLCYSWKFLVSLKLFQNEVNLKKKVGGPATLGPSAGYLASCNMKEVAKLPTCSFHLEYKRHTPWVF